MAEPEKITEAELAAKYEAKTGRELPSKAEKPTDAPGRLETQHCPRECPKCQKRFYVERAVSSRVQAPLRHELCRECRGVQTRRRPAAQMDLVRPTRTADDEPPF